MKNKSNKVKFKSISEIEKRYFPDYLKAKENKEDALNYNPKIDLKIEVNNIIKKILNN